jgi:hypothetical protein
VTVGTLFIMKNKTKPDKKISRVMQEFRAGTLKSSSGQKVKTLAQARAIALSEAGVSRKSKSDKKKKR